MSIRSVLLTSITLVAVAGPAGAQTAANMSAAQLLAPFTQLNNSAAGQGALADNLVATIAVNNNASAARVAQAVSDNNIIYTGQQFTNGLGSTLDAAYQQAVTRNDPVVATLTSQIQQFTNVSGSDSNFSKFYLANGTTNGTTKATGPALPAGGQFNTYDTAYGVTTGQSGQNPYGDSRPFQTAPGQISTVPSTLSGLTTNPSFPSGHTTFGSTVALLEAMAVPERFSQEIARGLDYGTSRVVLGVHYSLDVMAGRILALHAVADMLNGVDGYGSATTNQATFNAFQTTFRQTLARYAGTDVATAAAQDNGAYSAANAAQTTADAEYRLDYGIRPTGATNLPPVVPQGAEVLLATRFPYLSADQRRDVLASTELPSGFALDDGSGWARLDLYRAGLGYAALNAMTTVTQNAALGGLSAADTWSNAIVGTGGLTHAGTGTLALTGANSYTGGTIISGGRIVAGSATALGYGDVRVDGGTLEIATNRLTVGGNFTETATGILSLTELGRPEMLDVLGLATLGGLLQVNLDGFNVNGVYELIGWGSYLGQFANVSFTGLNGGLVTGLDYRSNGLFLSLTGGVPEPATWAMMILGFGLVGTTLRRRDAVARGQA